MTSFLEISLWFFACRPELESSFWIKHQSGEKIIPPPIFPAFFEHFFKNFMIGPRWVSKVINFRSGNPILNYKMNFPLFIPSPPPSSILKKDNFWSNFQRRAILHLKNQRRKIKSKKEDKENILKIIINVNNQRNCFCNLKWTVI